CWQIPTGFLRSRGTQGHCWATHLSPTGLSPSMALLSRQLRFQLVVPLCRPYNPDTAETVSVWANPLSLAATQGITIVFFSSGYLDVSVLRVGSTTPMYSV